MNRNDHLDDKALHHLWPLAACPFDPTVIGIAGTIYGVRLAKKMARQLRENVGKNAAERERRKSQDHARALQLLEVQRRNTPPPPPLTQEQAAQNALQRYTDGIRILEKMPLNDFEKQIGRDRVKQRLIKDLDKII